MTIKKKNHRFHDFDPDKAADLAQKLQAIMQDLLDYEATHTARINKLHRAYETSARNFLHYLALLRHDLFPMRNALSSFGFSSLGRSESHVLASILSVMRLLNTLLDRPGLLTGSYSRQVTYEQGHSLLDAHTEALFGPPPKNRRGRIMVTLASDAATDYAKVKKLIENGMDCARINCAHDDETVWRRMCDNVRRAAQDVGKHCRILMDLGGPKLRTGPLSPGPQVIKIRPTRNALGAIVKPCTVWLCDETAISTSPEKAATAIPVRSGWHKNLKTGDVLMYRDARKRLRRMDVTQKHSMGCLAKSEMTGYIVPDTEFHIFRRTKSLVSTGKVATLPCTEEFILLKPGDTLVLSAQIKPGKTARRAKNGRLLSPATISCTLPEVFADIEPGERICLDDGKITGVVESVSAQKVCITITAAKPQGSRLRADKGINLPDSELSTSGLTEKDVIDLAFIARHADIVALSFVSSPSDIVSLQRHLSRLGSASLGVVLKIETRLAIKRLPSLLLSAMASHPIGVMIARGDLAVELGFDNLAEAQDEILLCCEAAHVPVIWATQVLENLAKTGMPSRAEISDAAMSVRAECVMLNKGEYIDSAVTMLDSILKRMEQRSLDKYDHKKLRVQDRCFIGGLSDERK